MADIWWFQLLQHWLLLCDPKQQNYSTVWWMECIKTQLHTHEWSRGAAEDEEGRCFQVAGVESEVPRHHMLHWILSKQQGFWSSDHSALKLLCLWRPSLQVSQLCLMLGRQIMGHQMLPGLRILDSAWGRNVHYLNELSHYQVCNLVNQNHEVGHYNHDV